MTIEAENINNVKVMIRYIYIKNNLYLNIIKIIYI